MTRDIRSLARLISQVEAREPAALAQLKAVHDARTGARVIGITGPPGAGKSTLVDHLVRQLRAQQQRVAVIAIDPSSPFSGGAVLGDRIRMQSHAGDDGVFIRSVGSRGAHGGLSRSTRATVELCDAYGFGWIIIETVGVGQSEYDIMELADTTLVVLTPESGDTVQTLKAGLLEIADIFVVNKADRAGADTMAQGLSAMVQLGTSAEIGTHDDHDAQHRATRTSAAVAATPSQWIPPVLMATATQGTGIAAILEQINRHAQYVAATPAAQSRKAALRRREFLALCADVMMERLDVLAAHDSSVAQLIDDVSSGAANPYGAIDQLLVKFKSV